jgi:thiopeptide-type bacteriocin biosynthesis protein
MKFHSNFIFRSPINSCNSNDFQMEVFNEALYLASLALYEEHQKNIANPITNYKELKKLHSSLYKYQTRASHRCTPFGLFAGLSIGTWANNNDITISKNIKQTLHRKTRLDMNVLCNLAQELSKLLFVKPYLKFYPNTSIYLVGNSYRYVEYYYINNHRFHKINKVDFSEYLQYILNECALGLTHKQLSALLISNEISEEEANNFIDELISSQLLVNQLEPTVTGNDYFEVLLYNLNSIKNSNPNDELTFLINLLNEIDTLIKKNDEAILNSITTYKNIHIKLKTILPELNETNLFQTDLYKKTDSNFLNSQLQEQLKNTIQFLNRINPSNKNKNLQEFAKRFYERYEDYEIPLLIALDAETGVGYPSKDNNGVNDLIEDIITIRNSNNESDIKWNLLQTHLLKLITDSSKQNKKIVEISENDFKNIDFSDVELPSTCSIMFKVLNATTNKIDISNIGGSSAINLLGRFAGGYNKLGDIVKQIAEFEQAQISDKILAEIIHLPESRTGNILARPSFRAYEIPYLAKASVDDVFQIKMEDLILKVKGDYIILFDKRLKKEIIPRLGNAHNFSYNSLPVYHFLCDLQSQYFSKSFLGFNWGELSNQFDFLPRIEYKNTILSSAKWQLQKHHIESLQDKKKTEEEKIYLFFELKKRIELPDKFLIADGDNELLIDCNNSIAVDTFIDVIKNRNEITLEEYLFEDEHALIKDEMGNSFTNECIAIVFNENKQVTKSTSIDSIKFESQQVFAIGSEWLYYKIYCGAKTADYILTEKIKYITEQLLNEHIIDKWFFIRFADPDVHLRFRLHICDFEKYGHVLQLINKELEPLLNHYTISKIQTDTYKRELERYGDNSMDLVEQLFYTDSVFVTNMLDMLDAESGGTIRWKIALRSVDEFLSDFKLTPNEKYNLIDKLNSSFFNEHGGKKELKLILDNKFRTLRPHIEDVLKYNNDENKDYYPIIELINARSKSNAKIIDKLLLLNTKNQLQLSLNDLLASLLHMNIDRLFMGRNRTNEFVVYDLLFRYYKSTLARSKSASKKDISVVPNTI